MKLFKKKRQRKFAHKTRKFHLSLRLGLYLISFVLILVSILYLLFGSSLRINKIDCQLNAAACSTEQKNSLDIYQGSLILSLKPSQIRKKILLEFPHLQDATVELSFPHTLSVKLTLQTDFLNVSFTKYNPPAPSSTPTPQATSSATVSAQIISTLTPHPLISQLSVLPSPHQNLLLTHNGSLLETQDPPPKDIVIVYQDLFPPDDLLKAFYDFYQELARNGLATSNIWLYGQNIIIKKQRYFAILDINGSPRQLISSLQQILASSKISLDNAIIDLRFQKPTVTYY